MWGRAWALLLVVTLTGCATHAATSGRVVLRNDTGVIDIRIGEQDRAVIKRYYAGVGKKKRMPPGLAKRGGRLPPGLARRDALPPGLQREPLPAELEADLTHLPEPYLRVRVGTDIVLLDRRTQVIVDVARGLVP